MTITNGILNFAMVLITTTVCGCKSASVHGVSNFAIVNPGIYRGGEPTEEGWKYLKSIGVSNVVKLNMESEGSDKIAENLGMKVVSIPISTRQQIFGPVGPQLEIGLTNIILGTFVHCEYGKNRTGTLIMLFRRQHEGWSKEACEREANRYGWISSFPALKTYWRNSQ